MNPLLTLAAAAAIIVLLLAIAIFNNALSRLYSFIRATYGIFCRIDAYLRG